MKINARAMTASSVFLLISTPGGRTLLLGACSEAVAAAASAAEVAEPSAELVLVPRCFLLTLNLFVSRLVGRSDAPLLRYWIAWYRVDEARNFRVPDVLTVPEGGVATTLSCVQRHERVFLRHVVHSLSMEGLLVWMSLTAGLMARPPEEADDHHQQDQRNGCGHFLS